MQAFQLYKCFMKFQLLDLYVCSLISCLYTYYVERGQCCNLETIFDCFNINTKKNVMKWWKPGIYSRLSHVLYGESICLYNRYGYFYITFKTTKCESPILFAFLRYSRGWLYLMTVSCIWSLSLATLILTCHFTAPILFIRYSLSKLVLVSP